MLYVCLNDMIVKRAKNDEIATNTRGITNMVLWIGLGGLIANGTIGLAFLGEMLVLGCANRGTKWIIKNRKRLLKKVSV